ncbi:MAG: hypothetical protein ABI693_31375 [Bryobacteraceae bacterium]
MWELTKRRFLQLSGLAIADRIMPWKLAAQTIPSDKRKVIIVTFGGGVRYSETFAPEGLRNIPALAALKPEGRFFRTCTNAGVLSHFNSSGSILTGQWQRVDDFGMQRPASPTIFEYYRKATKAKAVDCWAVCTNKSFSALANSDIGDFGTPYGANLVLPKQLLLDAVGEVVKKKDGDGAASREVMLRQLEGILNEGYEGLGWTIFKAGRELDRTVRDTLRRSLVEYINGPESPTSGDELTYFVSREIMREFAPRVMLVNFWDMDVAHWGSYSLYLQAVTKTDRLVGMLWEEIRTNPHYKDKTTLLVLPELGRDGDANTANGFLNHRSGDASCRNMWMLAMGAGVEKGETERPISHIDIAATTASLLGVKTGEMAGRSLPELS